MVVAAPPIARGDAVALMHSVPLYSILYGQGYIAQATDRRADCSGWQSYVWRLPKTGPGTSLNAFTTQSLWEQGLIREIPRSELLPGDAIGYCGPGTANGGGGHVAPFLESNGDRVRVIDHGSGMGPKDRWVTWNKSSTGWLAPGKCKAWRYVGMQEDGMGLVVEDAEHPGAFYVLGPDFSLSKITGDIESFGWVASGRWSEAVYHAGRPAGIPLSNTPLNAEPWLEIPKLLLSAIAVAGPAAGGALVPHTHELGGQTGPASPSTGNQQ